MRLTIALIFLLGGCGPIPVQISKQSQEQTQRTSQEVAQEVLLDYLNSKA